MSIPRTLVLTGHFPPSSGGVQTYVQEVVDRLPADRLVVQTIAQPGARELDATLPYPVHRRHAYQLQRGLRRLVRAHGIEAAWVPAMAPIGLWIPALRWAGVERVVATTHGQELGWVRVAPTREALRLLARRADAVTVLSETTRAELEPVLGRPGLLHLLPGGVDGTLFQPAPARSAGPPTVVSVARLVRRKGHDRLLEAWPAVLERVPDARLVVVGEGPMAEQLRAAAAQPGLRGSVSIPGRLPREELLATLRGASAFVLACRDDRHGLQTEGLGLATLEASAAGLPVVVGRSGGSGDALVDGVTGHLVDARRPAELSSALLDLLLHPERARAMGEAGRAWVASRYTWERTTRGLAALLRGEPVEAQTRDAA